MLETFTTIIHVLVSLFLVLVVLLQGGNQGGMGAAFGGGNSQGVFGATGATSLLGKLTYWAAGIFMMTTISLTLQQGAGGDIGLKEKLKAKAGETTKTDGEENKDTDTPSDGGKEPSKQSDQE